MKEFSTFRCIVDIVEDILNNTRCLGSRHMSTVTVLRYEELVWSLLLVINIPRCHYMLLM